MKKTRRRDGDVPGPSSPWDEIAPGLWMGGHYWAGSAGELWPAVVEDEFDLVISLFTRTGHGPGPRAEHIVADIPDAELTAGQLHTVQRLAHTAGLALDSGLTTLVRCHSGYNRSGLVVAQCLVDRGLTPAEAIARVRRGRSSWALHNEAFTSYLTAGLDIAALLVGLDP
ncbi:protein phosphatase [Streptomyces avidinii]|uniref:protein-tyrosine phosphatase family protein n=1 Tax=Streptomyces avidinii TaxID=1895 RepID=UPI003867CE5F|nr:protein phosphatase [Streptomyces avidinii]